MPPGMAHVRACLAYANTAQRNGSIKGYKSRHRIAGSVGLSHAEAPLWGKLSPVMAWTAPARGYASAAGGFYVFLGGTQPLQVPLLIFWPWSLDQSMKPWLCPQVAVLLETEEVISEGFQSSKSARLQSGAIRKVVLSLVSDARPCMDWSSLATCSHAARQ